MDRIPKLTTYEGFTNAGSPPAHHLSAPPEDQEKFDSKPAKTQTSLPRYIPIQSITRVRAGQKKKTKRKKYKNKKLTDFGYKYRNGGPLRGTTATATSSALIVQERMLTGHKELNNSQRTAEPHYSIDASIYLRKVSSKERAPHAAAISHHCHHIASQRSF